MPERAIVLSPHPDDEVLGAGGLILHLHERGVPVAVIAVTDGESSHAQSTLVTPEQLRAWRADERRAAFRALGVDLEVTRLGLRDGGVAQSATVLTQIIRSLADESTLVIAPWRHDRHPDHEATGAAAAAACEIVGATLWEIPIWAKVEAAMTSANPPGRASFVLSADQQARKEGAVACYRSQTVGLSDRSVDGPVIRREELDALLDGRESVFWT